MKEQWHEQIQRQVNGLASAEEVAALEAALKQDAKLRALYLDYMNLDAALDAAATFGEDETGRFATFPKVRAAGTAHSWRWLTATAALAALIMLALLPSQRDASRERAQIATTIASTQDAIARLSLDTVSPLPAWMSPTASLLAQPDVSQ